MNPTEMGNLIRRLRTEQSWTQQALAERLAVSEQAVSKWERGLGCPDPSLLPQLAKLLGVEVGTLLAGEVLANRPLPGNLKNTRFYCCPHCGNILTAVGEASVSCCGKVLQPLTAQKPDAAHDLSVEVIDNEFFVSGAHPMLREHHISFVALLTGDSLVLRKLYPEWDLQTRLPHIMRLATLVWYCTEHGLFARPILASRLEKK